MSTRRQFMALAGGVAVAWPVLARAQQAEKARLIGVLMGYAQGDSAGQARVAAFRQGMSERGWSEDRNARFVVRWGGADPQLIRNYAAELIGMRPDVIVANTGPVVAELRRQTTSVPIVFVLLNDPVGAGIVPNLARPGGNITGFSAYENETSAKWPELLSEIAPKTKRALLVAHSDSSNRAAYLSSIEAATRSLGIELVQDDIRNAAEIERAVASVAATPNSGLIVIPGPFTAVNRAVTLSLAARYQLPSVYPFRYYAVEGGLVSYGVNASEIFRASASYVERIFKGEKPGDLPVQLPTKFELVINLKTAKALGLTVPPKLLFTADEVIE